MQVLIADDHVAIRMIATELAKQVFSDPVIRGVGDVAELFGALDAQRTDLLVLDLSMPGDLQRVELVRAISARADVPRILIYSADSSPCLVTAALEAGATGYITKGAPISSLREAIRVVSTGERYVDERIATDGATHPWRLLTMAEREVIKALMTGRTAKQVAGDTGRAYNTIATLRSSGMQKLGLRYNEEMAAYFHEHGLLFELDTPRTSSAAQVVGSGRFPKRSNVIELRPASLSAEDISTIETISSTLLGTEIDHKLFATTTRSLIQFIAEYGKPDLTSNGFKFPAVRWRLAGRRLLVIDAKTVRITVEVPVTTDGRANRYSARC